MSEIDEFEQDADGLGEDKENRLWQAGSSLTAGEFSEFKLDVTLVLNTSADDTEASIEIAEPAVEVPLFALASVNQRTAPSVEVPWSQLLALSMTPKRDPPVLAVGRHRQCNVQLKDPRVSLRHFEIVAHKRDNGLEQSDLGDVTYECVLNDLSSNGTAINGRIVGKGKSCKIRSGDEVCVLPASRVGEDQKIAFIFRNTTEMLSAPKQVPAVEKLQEFKLAELVTCPICLLAIYNCVALTPCMHNFCSGCYSDWMQRNTTCPVCRHDVDVVIKNHAMDEVIEAVQEAAPDMRRSEEEKQQWNEMDRLKFRGNDIVHSVRPAALQESASAALAQRRPQGSSRAGALSAASGRSRVTTSRSNVSRTASQTAGGNSSARQNCAIQ